MHQFVLKQIDSVFIRFQRFENLRRLSEICETPPSVEYCLNNTWTNRQMTEWHRDNKTFTVIGNRRPEIRFTVNFLYFWFLITQIIPMCVFYYRTWPSGKKNLLPFGCQNVWCYRAEIAYYIVFNIRFWLAVLEWEA